MSRAQTAVESLYRGDRASQSCGIEIVEVAPGRVSVAMTVRADMVNGHGMCHGGVIFALADSAFAFACNSYDVAMIAAGANIEFLKPAPVGARLAAAARELSRDARRGIYDVAVTDTAGELVAHFRGRCARLRAPAPLA